MVSIGIFGSRIDRLTGMFQFGPTDFAGDNIPDFLCPYFQSAAGRDER